MRFPAELLPEITAALEIVVAETGSKIAFPGTGTVAEE
jgi:hypothetical protein